MNTFLRIITLITFLTIGFGSIWGQNYTLEGTITDTVSTPLPAATVVLLQAEDSVLVQFALTGNEGQFQVKNISAGDYLLQVTFIGYQRYNEKLTVEGKTNVITLDPIELRQEDVSLGEVTIEGERTPIIMKKDTLQYNADAFQTQANDVVEDLLKKLPGVEVEEDGTIKAQGETVNRVLVDGEEFFGEDPKMATKNLPANAVKNVQVFDKKSEMAEFSGVDDGNEEKTINLTLKEDKKKGMFGNVSAGYGTEDRFDGKANINRFSKKMQLSFLGQFNNINRQGFSFQDYVGLMGGFQNISGGARGFTFSSGDAGLNLGTDLSSGFVTTGAGGVNFNYTFKKNTKLNISYFLNHIKNEAESNSFRENFLAASPFTSLDSSSRESTNLNHRVNVTFRHEIDSTQQFSIRSTATWNQTDSKSEYVSLNLREGTALESSSDRDNSGDGDGININSELTYRKKLGKPGRSVSLQGNFGLQQNEQLINTLAFNRFFENQAFVTDTLNQNQLRDNNQFNFGAKVNYTEPLGGGKFLNLSYTHRNFDDDNIQDVYDLEPFLDPEEIRNIELSRRYNRGYTYDNTGVSLRFNKDKLRINGGAELQWSRLNGEIEPNPEPIKQNFFNVLPSLRMQYEFAQSKNLTFDYRTRVQEPSLEQLSPLVDNRDPFNIYSGNPDLKPSFSHTGSLRYFSFSQFNFISFFANIRATYTDNKIVNERTIDENFVQFSRPINVSSDWNINSWLSFGAPLNFIKSRFSINGNVTYNRGLVFVNATENILQRLISNIGIRLNNRETKVIDISLSANYTHTNSTYSVSDDLDQTFLTQRYSGSLTYNFLKSWAISTAMNYQIYSGEAFADNQTVPIWTASLSKFIMEKRGEFRLSAFDLLNRNLGVSRNSNLNYIEETRTTSLSRYFLFSFIYSLSKFGAKAPGGAIRIMR